MNPIDETFFDMMQEQLWMEDDAEHFEDEYQYFDALVDEISAMDEEYDLEEQMLEQEVAIAEERVVADFARTQGNQDVFSLFELWIRETILHATALVNYDIFYYIFISSPWMMTREVHRRVVRTEPMDTYETYWTIKHPNLSDDRNSRHSYRAHYRVNKSTF